MGKVMSMYLGGALRRQHEAREQRSFRAAQQAHDLADDGFKELDPDCRIPIAKPAPGDLCSFCSAPAVLRIDENRLCHRHGDRVLAAWPPSTGETPYALPSEELMDPPSEQEVL